MYLSFLVTICGACVMILEIVASRFFAPYIGSSLTVWTSLIGIVMAGLAVGYALGGALADKWQSLRRLQMMVTAAGVWILLLMLIRHPVLQLLSGLTDSVMTVAITGTVVLLVFPSVLLGMVTPYSIRLMAKDISTVGHTAGRLGALSTAGSIAGTFLAGFVLIPLLGVSNILLLLSLTLILTALWGLNLRRAVVAIVALVVAASALEVEQGLRAHANSKLGIVHEQDSAYSTVWIRKMVHKQNNEPFYMMQIDTGQHGAKYLNTSEHVFGYSLHYRAVDLVRPDAKNALLIGGGTYTVAQDFLERHEGSSVDAVEIDPLVTELAKEYFGVTDDPRLRIYHRDGRAFINQAESEQYDAIFGDAFRSNSTVPFHLATKEAAREIARLLTADGVYLMNVIGSKEGPQSEYPKAQLETLKAVFPSVFAFEVHLHGDNNLLRNFIYVASKQSISLDDLIANNDGSFDYILDSLITNTQWSAGAMVLTDEYAPVEEMLL